MEAWARNGLGRFDPSSMRGRKCYGGLDLSSKIDLSGFVKLFPPVSEGERWRLVARFWMPADTVAEKADRDRVQYQRWIDEGWIEPTGGNIIDHNEIQRAILEDHRDHELLALAYDPWNATQLAVGLQTDGVPVFEFIQGIRSYTAPTKELEALLIGEKLDHGNNPVLAWMASNLAVQTDKNDNRMPTKKHSSGRIDGMSALIMAIGRSMSEDGAKPYSDGRDLLVL
jgi:phage terminase large subunit-like protein